MLSNAIESVGFILLILAADLQFGKNIAIFTAAAVCFFVGFALSDVQIPKRKQKPKPKRSDEPLTNRQLDAPESAQ